MEKINIIITIWVLGFVIDFLTLKFLKIGFKKIFLLFLQVPKICALVLTFVYLDKLWVCVLSWLVAKLICLFFVTDSFKIGRMLEIAFLNISISFSFSGFSWFILKWFKLSLENVFLQKIPLKCSFLLIFAIFLYVIAFFKLVRMVEKNKFLKKYLLNVSFNILGKHICFYGLVDSGNSLIDPLTKKQVVLVSLQSLAKYLTIEEIDWLLEFRSRKILCESVGNSNFEIPIFEGKDLVISSKDKTQKYSCMIGVVDKKFDGGKFDCLLHRDFM